MKNHINDHINDHINSRVRTREAHRTEERPRLTRFAYRMRSAGGPAALWAPH